MNKVDGEPMMKKTTLALLAALLWCSAATAQLPFWEGLKQGETSTLHLPWDGLNGVFQVTGTLGGASVTLQWKLRGAEVFTVVEDVTSRGGAADCALTTSAEYCWFRAAPQVRLRPVVTGGDGTTDINVYLSAGDHASVGGSGGLSGISEFAYVVGDGSGSVVDSNLVEEDGTRLAIGLTAAAAAAKHATADVFIRGAVSPSLALQHGTGQVFELVQLIDGTLSISDTANASSFQIFGGGGVRALMLSTGHQVIINGVEAELVWTSGPDDFQMGQLDVAGELTIRDEGTTRWYLDNAGNIAVGGSTNPARPMHVFGGLRLEPADALPSSPSLGDMTVDSSGTDALCAYLDGAWVVVAGTGTCA